MNQPTISVIGLGYIGLPTAATLANAGLDVLGIDVSDSVVNTINSGDIHISEQGLDILVRAAVHRKKLRASTEVQAADIHIIAVPTPITKEKEPDLSYVEAATKSIAKVLRPGDLVILESTVPPATCTGVVGKLIEDLTGLQHLEDYYLSHCPERVIPGKILHEIIHNDRIIGGTTPEATEKTAALYRRFVKGKLLLTNATTAELCKLMENTYRDVNIALANELAGIAEGLDVNISEAITLANHHPRVNIHTPGIGVGGHCIPVDPWFIVHAAKDRAEIIAKARHINDTRPHGFAERILSLIKASPNKQVALLGLSYKPDVDDLRESPATEIIEEVAKNTSEKLWIVEPHVLNLPSELGTLDHLELVELSKAVKEADVLIQLVPHTQFKAVADHITDVMDLPLEQLEPVS